MKGIAELEIAIVSEPKKTRTSFFLHRRLLDALHPGGAIPLLP